MSPSVHAPESSARAFRSRALDSGPYRIVQRRSPAPAPGSEARQAPHPGQSFAGPAIPAANHAPLPLLRMSSRGLAHSCGS
jgi:hypothetical protein